METLSASLSMENLNDAQHIEFGAGKRIERSAFVPRTLDVLIKTGTCS